MNLAAGQFPDQPGLHRPEQQLSRFGLLPCVWHMVQDPFQLGGRKISVDHKAGLLTELLGQAAGLQLVAVGAGARHCQTMAWQTGSPVSRSHTMVVSRWLVMPMAAMSSALAPIWFMADRATPSWVVQISLASCSTHPGRGKYWGEFLLCNAAHLSRLIEQDAAVGCGACIQCHDVGHRCSLLYLSPGTGGPARKKCRTKSQGEKAPPKAWFVLHGSNGICLLLWRAERAFFAWMSAGLSARDPFSLYQPAPSPATAAASAGPGKNFSKKFFP